MKKPKQYNVYQKTKKRQSQKNITGVIIKIVIICIVGYITYMVYSSILKTEKALQKPSPFVSREGTNLMFENEVFHVIGVNDYSLAYGNNKTIDQAFMQLHNAGVNTVRFWLFDDGDANGFQPNPGVYNESRFAQADYVLFDAKKYNIKVIPVLVNNWTDYGGKDQYLKWVGINPSSNEAAFYTDDQINSLFEQYINHILTRENTYTHVRYSNDPTILGWDIMNEPRSNDQNAMNNWLIATANSIKKRDPNHLVFAGTEASTSPLFQDESTNLCSNSAIDICSVHLYLFNGNQPLFDSYNDVTNFMQMQKNYADSVNKPLIMGEFGIAQDTKPFGQDQLSTMQQVIDLTKQENYAGYLIWDWSPTNNSPMTFSPSGNTEGRYTFTDLKNLLH